VEFGDYSSTLVAIASTIGLFLLSGVVPIVNAEVSVILLGSVAPPPLLPVLLVVATFSHMVGKSLTYLAGRWAERWPYAPLQRQVAAARAKIERRTTLGGTIIFVSAAIGLPPFYVVSVGSGIVRFNFLHYFAFGFAGRLVRFAALLWIPQLARALMPAT
jgi:membrane protein YqaA with SNARE-associated domain